MKWGFLRRERTGSPSWEPALDLKALDKAGVAALLRSRILGRRYVEAREILAQVGLDLLHDYRRCIAEAPPLTPRRLLFICGLHRSGTTLLEQHLTARYRVARLRARVPENEGQFLQDVFPSEQPYGGPGHFAFYPQMAMRPLTDPQAARAAATRILHTWEPWIECEGDVLVEKSPPNITRIPYLRSLFPDARFVIWTRDPRAVSVSTRRWGPPPLPTLMMHWNAAYMRAIEGLEEDCIVESYEAFCEDPEASLKRIADFCDLGLREEPLTLPPRFSRIENQNEKYIEKLPEYRDRSKIKAWELFGYEF
jgi:hypothetical protein